ncbi:ABC transporter ATP-binding protein [Pseudoxanthomonas sacheonensis]|uniref:Iron complex transport system ATP-binding protein n=1 Tax=Pseudoxanthomonas sacheonensis TaxID=443615 RepID=A0ABU1RT01_9GAMM|nr:ATP-binding cassette domain-containing protein [Pseudoxanthomonas sacheonensis]MDR6841911.1 iron complex transport system ATP-binding protein [Pseudoxanthomonas sacheonensis]
MPLPSAGPAPDAASTPLIELDRATVVRGDAAVLHALSLRIVAGQHTVLLGPNGCGKSSFIKLINRELYPLAREGESPVKVMGQDRWNVNDLRTRLGVVTGDLTRDLLDMPDLVVSEAVLTGFFASLMLPPDSRVTDDMRERMNQALAQVHASALTSRRVAELSTGEMRRVLIARALVHRPQALLLDEPTAGLDLVAQRDFLQLMRTLAQQDITLVLVTHHIEEIVPEIDRVILLRAGSVYADGDRAGTLTSENLSAVFGGALQVRCEGERYFASSL